MLKILIVDDEMLVRIGIRTLLNWEEYGFEIAGEASDGHEALALYETLRPDIVMTDIVMPKMDGLDLTRLLKERYPYVFVVILTCIDEIESANRAMLLGANAYITKISMDKRHILDVLLTLREKLETCGGGLNVGQMRNYLVRNRFVMRWDYLRELLARQEDGDTVYFPNPFLSRELYKSANFFVILRLPQLKNKRDTDYFYEIVEGSLAAWTKEYAVFPLNEAACLAMGHLESDRAADAGIVHELQNAVKTYTNLSCQCLYSAGCRSIEDVGLLYCEYLDGSFSRDNGQNREEEGGGRLNELERAIHAQDTREAARVTEELARELLGGGVKPDYMRRVCLRFFSLYEKEFRQLGETIDSLFDENLVERVMNMDGARQLAEYMTETGGRFMDALRKLSGKAYRKDIAEIIQFIRLHYAETLSLTYLAGLVNMNSVYFSRLFKQVTEVTFVEYLTRVRMERAKELLRGDYIKMEEVAGRVGYDDVQYFSKAFKKYEGISPSRFRENAAAEHRGNPLR